MHHNAFFELQCNSFIDTHFFYFGINTGVAIAKKEFEKDNFSRGNELSSKDNLDDLEDL